MNSVHNKMKIKPTFPDHSHAPCDAMGSMGSWQFQVFLLYKLMLKYMNE